MGYLDEWIDKMRDPFAAVTDFYHNPFRGGAMAGGPLHMQTLQWYDDLTASPAVPADEIKLNKTSNTAKRPVIYGMREKVGGNIDFIGTTGTNNEYLWVLLDICEGEIGAINEVYIDDVAATNSVFNLPLDARPPIGDLASLLLPGGGAITRYVTVFKHLGAADQPAPPELMHAFPALWTTQHRLRGVAYVVVCFYNYKKKFSALPNICCDILGKKVLDLSTGWTYASISPAYCLYDYLINPIYGKALNDSDINRAFLLQSAEYQATMVQAHTASDYQTALLQCHIYLDTSRKLVDNIKALILANQAGLPRIAGKFCLIVEKDYPSVFDFDEDNIIGGWQFSGGESSAKYNEAEITFANTSLQGRDDTVQVTSAVLLEQDGGFTQSVQVSPAHVIDAVHAKDLANLEIKRSRQQLTCAFTAAPSALVVVPGSIVTVSHATPGWTLKKFRVMECTITPHGLVEVTLREHESATYDREIPIEYIPPPDTGLVNPFNVPPPSKFTLRSGDAYLLLGTDGTIVSRIYATWAAPVGYPYVSGYALEFRKYEDIDWLSAGTVMTTAGLNAYVAPVEDGLLYEVRVCTLGASGRQSAWLTSTPHSVIGKMAPPPDVETFTASEQSDGTRQFDWSGWTSTTEVNGVTTTVGATAPADLAGYMIRFSYTEQPWENMTPLHEGILVASPWETNLVASGAYHFGIVAVDTSGHISPNPNITSATFGNPRVNANAVYWVDVKRDSPPWDGDRYHCHIYDDPLLGNVLLPSSEMVWGPEKTWQANLSVTIPYQAVDIGIVDDFGGLPTVNFLAGKHYLTVGSVVFISDDNCATFTSVDLGKNLYGNASITYNGTDKFVLVGYEVVAAPNYFNPKVFTSADGAAWTEVDVSTLHFGWDQILWSSTLSKFIVASTLTPVAGSLLTMYSSTAGATWAEIGGSWGGGVTPETHGVLAERSGVLAVTLGASGKVATKLSGGAWKVASISPSGWAAGFVSSYVGIGSHSGTATAVVVMLEDLLAPLSPTATRVYYSVYNASTGFSSWTEIVGLAQDTLPGFGDGVIRDTAGDLYLGFSEPFWNSTGGYTGSLLLYRASDPTLGFTDITYNGYGFNSDYATRALAWYPNGSFGIDIIGENVLHFKLFQHVGGSLVRKNGHWFRVKVNGTTGAVEPTWVTTSVGAETADNSVTWEYMGLCAPNTWTEYTTWAAAIYAEFSFTSTIDLGEALPITPYVSVAGLGELVVEERHWDALADPPAYTDWALLGDGFVGGLIEFRVSCDATGIPLGMISEMRILLLGTAVSEDLFNIDTSTLSGATPGIFRLPITKSYAKITQVVLAMHGEFILDGGALGWRIMDKDPTLGPLIHIFDSEGNNVDCTIDAYIRGAKK